MVARFFVPDLVPEAGAQVPLPPAAAHHALRVLRLRAGEPVVDDVESENAEVQVIEPTGPDLLVFVTLNQTKVCCRLAPDIACRVGDSLNLQFDPTRVLLFDAASGERLGGVGNLQAHAPKDNVAQFKGR